jgi:phosphate transport system substrate-binding protein
MKKARFVKAAVAVLSLSFVLATPANAVDLVGSGASFPDGLIQGCKAGFASASTNTYQYNVSSSGGGQSDAKIGKGDFWFSDGIFTTALGKPATMLHAPIVAGPVAIAYNLNGNSGKTLSLSADTISGIFSGKITKWNDPAIVKDSNKTVTVTKYVTKNGVIVKNADGTNKVASTRTSKVTFTLPNRAIKVVYRADDSGTTENFINYLKGATTTDPGWTKGKSFASAFKGVGNIDGDGNLGRYIGRQKSQGVALEVARTKDSITYVEASFAADNNIPVASVYNASGSLVSPVAPGAVGAFLGFAKAGAEEGTYAFDYKTTEKGAYPISIVSYMVFDTKYASASTATAVKSLANYILSPACAETVGSKLGFAVITGKGKEIADKMIAQIGSK